MWWIIGITVIIISYVIINKDHKEHVQAHISNFGGMMEKYKTLIEYLKSGGLCIKKVTQDCVVLSSKSMIWTLDYVGVNLEVRMKGYMPLLGNINKKWIFPDDYPQEKMIEEFENYFNWQIEQLKKGAQNNPYEHLNNE